MYFCGPGNSLQAIADPSATAAHKRGRPLSISIDYCVRPAGICRVRCCAGNTVVSVLFRGAHISVGDIDNAAVPQVSIATQQGLWVGIKGASTNKIGDVGVI